MENKIYNSNLNSLKETIKTPENHDLRVKMPNLLLIAGNGRNVGKTFLACKIIQYLSKKEEVFGLKISPHFHSYNKSDIIISNEHFLIIDEKQINTKDSSLMLQSGAKKVFFIMVKTKYFHLAVEQLIQLLPNGLIVCESGGLHDFVVPGLFLMVKRNDEEITKTHLLKYAPIIVNNDGNNFDFDVRKIETQNNKFSLKNNNGKV